MTPAPKRDDRLFAIVDAEHGHLANLCLGPLADGGCPHVARGTLPCAGGRVVPLDGTQADGLPFTVNAAASGPRCPMAWLDDDDS